MTKKNQDFDAALASVVGDKPWPTSDNAVVQAHIDKAREAGKLAHDGEAKKKQDVLVEQELAALAEPLVPYRFVERLTDVVDDLVQAQHARAAAGRGCSTPWQNAQRHIRDAIACIEQQTEADKSANEAASL